MIVQNLVGCVPSQVSWVQYHCAIVPWGVFRGSKSFSRGYFVGLKCFLVGILWVQSFFSGVLYGSKYFPRGYFVDHVVNFVIQRFSLASCMRKSEKKQKYINTSQTMHSIPNRFEHLSVLLNYTVMQLSFVLIVFLAISFFQYRTSSLVTVIDNYSKTICPIVSLVIQIS